MKILYNLLVSLHVELNTSPSNLETSAMAKTNKLDMEATLAQLEATIDRLEEEQLGVADSLAAFEAGLKLLRRAQKDLQQAEQRIVALVEEDGNPASKPFLEENKEE